MRGTPPPPAPPAPPASSRAPERLAERRHVAFRLIPGDDEARFACALRAPVVELESGRAQRPATLGAEPDEHLVRLHGVQERGARGSTDGLREGVGAPGVAPPYARFEVREQLRRDVAGLGEQVAGALAAQLEVPDQRGIEEHHRLGASAPFFVAPKDSTSMPARQVMSAGWQPRKASAFAKRAPSMCTLSPRSWAIAQSSASGSRR